MFKTIDKSRAKNFCESSEERERRRMRRRRESGEMIRAGQLRREGWMQRRKRKRKRKRKRGMDC